jgi:hypothetical protein
MEYQRVSETYGRPTFSGYTPPGEDIELIRSPQNNNLSPTLYPHDPKRPDIYQNLQESAPYYNNQSQQNLAQPESDPPCKLTPWRAGFFKRFPVGGFGALLVSFLCIVGPIIVLILSNQQPVTDWKVQPTVILAIFSAIFNLAIVYALSQGAEISWWYVLYTRSDFLL